MGAELPDYQSYFNSRPHGGRQARPIFFDASRDFNSRPHGRLKKPAIEISTHALTEGDQKQMALKPPGCRFQLTPSRRATARGVPTVPTFFISTHALTEGDRH